MIVDSKRLYGFYFAQVITSIRVIFTFLFIVLSPYTKSSLLLLVYIAAGITDSFDGLIARSYKATTKLGGAFDLFGDKYLTVISCIYVYYRGIHIFPIVIIIFRDLFSMAMRSVKINGEYILGCKRVIGGILEIILWGSTALVIISNDTQVNIYYNIPYYIIALFYLYYFPYRIFANKEKIINSVLKDLGYNPRED